MRTDFIIEEPEVMVDWSKYGNLFQCTSEPSLIVLGNSCDDELTFEGTVLTTNKVQNTPIGEFRRDWEKGSFKLIPDKVTISFVP